MAPYSMDLRKRVLEDRGAGIPSRGGGKFRCEPVLGESADAAPSSIREVAGPSSSSSRIGFVIPLSFPVGFTPYGNGQDGVKGDDGWRRYRRSSCGV